MTASRPHPFASVLAVVARLMSGVTVRWVDSAPAMRQRVYFANHSSHLDAVVLWAALPTAARVLTSPVAGIDYWGKSRLRRYLADNVFQALLINRQPKGAERSLAAAEAVMADLVAAIDRGRSLIVFPEGTRGLGDEVAPFKSGIYHLARQRPHVELVPAYLENLNRILPKGEVLPVPILSSATFGPSVQLADGEDKAAFPVQGPRRRRPPEARLMPALNRELVWLFGGILALLVASSIIGRVLRRRARSDSGRATVDNLVARIKAWWFMCGIFAITLAVGRAGSLVLFGLLSFLALREFITLTRTHRADHRTLFWAFFVFTPLQYWLVGVQWYGMFALLIPVYAFLFVAARVAAAGDTQRFLERAAEIHFGLMLCVFCVSHAPALLMLDDSRATKAATPTC